MPLECENPSIFYIVTLKTIEDNFEVYTLFNDEQKLFIMNIAANIFESMNIRLGEIKVTLFEFIPTEYRIHLNKVMHNLGLAIDPR